MTKPLSERLLDILDNDLSMPECADHVMLAITEAAARLKELEDAPVVWMDSCGMAGADIVFDELLHEPLVNNTKYRLVKERE